MTLPKLLQTTVIILLLDGIFLSLLSSFYSKAIQNIQKSKLQLRYSSMIFTYIIVIAGLYHFIIQPGRSTYEGGLFGLVIYGIYNGTNYSIFKNWPLKVFLLDIAWGTILFATTTKIIKLLN